MTRTHAAIRLLEHGPLTHAEVLAITRWADDTVHSVLRNLVETGVAFFTEEMGCRRRVYQLREGAGA